MFAYIIDLQCFTTFQEVISIVTYQDAGVFLKAISEETRLKIVSYLAHDTFCVCKLVQMLGMSQPSISQHLKRLKEAGMILEEKRGKWTFHSLNTEHPLYHLLLQLVHSLPSVKEETEKTRIEGKTPCN